MAMTDTAQACGNCKWWVLFVVMLSGGTEHLIRYKKFDSIEECRASKKEYERLNRNNPNVRYVFCARDFYRD